MCQTSREYTDISSCKRHHVDTMTGSSCARRHVDTMTGSSCNGHHLDSTTSREHIDWFVMRQTLPGHNDRFFMCQTPLAHRTCSIHSCFPPPFGNGGNCCSLTRTRRETQQAGKVTLSNRAIGKPISLEPDPSAVGRDCF